MSIASMTKPFLLRMAVGGALVLAAGAGITAPAASGDSAVPAPFTGTEIEARLRGRERVALPAEDVSAWRDPHGGAAWYLDSRNGIAGTRDGFFRLVDGRPKPLDKDGLRRFRRDMAQRLEVPAKLRRTFGNGKRDLVLLTAYDCEGCSWLQQELRSNAALLDVRIHYVIGTLDPDDAQARGTVRSITCAADPVRAYWALEDDEDATLPEPAKDCAGQDDTFGYLFTLLGARYLPWLVDKASGEVIPFDSLESDTIVSLLNAAR